MARPWIPVVLLALVAAGATAAVQERGPLPIQESSCWECHSQWTPPLKVPAQVIPLASSAKVGSVLPAALQVRNAWQAEMRHVMLDIDLTRAPSLAFVATTPPLHTNTTLTLQPDPTQPGTTQAQQTAMTLNASATQSQLIVRPSSTDAVAGPRLVAVLTYPDGRTIRHLAPGRGQSIVLAGALDHTVGPIGVRVELPGLQPDAGNITNYMPPTATVHVTVQADAWFDTATQRQSAISIPVQIDHGKFKVLGGLNFTIMQAAQVGENIRFRLNTTVFYHHTTSGAQDWGNWTQEPVEVSVEQVGDRVAFVGASAPPPAPAPLNGPTMTTVGETVGYAASFLIVSSISSGGMFGKASRRGINNLFGSAKRRVAFHNFLSYGLILAAGAHMVLFLLDGDYSWTRGILWGGGGMLALLGLGVTGALQVHLIRRWNYDAWRWTHYGMALAVIVLTIVHLLLDGKHFGPVQGALGYTDPLHPT
ncbi:MAG TPA: ferric reductase-like transmembrane domain-containing protein [Candidatus Thermoplasmatota archaeon]|nr:ferric reductase-like transmembrane domain-containing protein [Candidatus Thermoplasmatota archaeon]